MICPQCGENLHRSRSRNFRESAIKSITPYKTFRCSDCGWRGMIVPPKSTSDAVSWRIRLVWIVGVVTALIIGLYTARLLAF